MNGAMEVAQQSDHPRAFEVVFQGAKHTADVLDKLQDLQKKQKDITKEQRALLLLVVSITVLSITSL